VAPVDVLLASEAGFLLDGVARVLRHADICGGGSLGKWGGSGAEACRVLWAGR
jgi:hypothetical protein